eukprot:g16174.t1
MPEPLAEGDLPPADQGENAERPAKATRTTAAYGGDYSGDGNTEDSKFGDEAWRRAQETLEWERRLGPFHLVLERLENILLAGETLTPRKIVAINVLRTAANEQVVSAELVPLGETLLAEYQALLLGQGKTAANLSGLSEKSAEASLRSAKLQHAASKVEAAWQNLSQVDVSRLSSCEKTAILKRIDLLLSNWRTYPKTCQYVADLVDYQHASMAFSTRMYALSTLQHCVKSRFAQFPARQRAETYARSLAWARTVPLRRGSWLAGLDELQIRSLGNSNALVLFEILKHEGGKAELALKFQQERWVERRLIESVASRWLLGDEILANFATVGSCLDEQTSKADMNLLESNLAFLHMFTVQLHENAEQLKQSQQVMLEKLLLVHAEAVWEFPLFILRDYAQFSEMPGRGSADMSYGQYQRVAATAMETLHALTALWVRVKAFNTKFPIENMGVVIGILHAPPIWEGNSRMRLQALQILQEVAKEKSYVEIPAVRKMIFEDTLLPELVVSLDGALGPRTQRELHTLFHPDPADIDEDGGLVSRTSSGAELELPLPKAKHRRKVDVLPFALAEQLITTKVALVARMFRSYPTTGRTGAFVDRNKFRSSYGPPDPVAESDGTGVTDDAMGAVMAEPGPPARGEDFRRRRTSTGFLSTPGTSVTFGKKSTSDEASRSDVSSDEEEQKQSNLRFRGSVSGVGSSREAEGGSPVAGRAIPEPHASAAIDFMLAVFESIAKSPSVEDIINGESGEDDRAGKFSGLSPAKDASNHLHLIPKPEHCALLHSVVNFFTDYLKKMTRIEAKRGPLVRKTNRAVRLVTYVLETFPYRLAAGGGLSSGVVGLAPAASAPRAAPTASMRPSFLLGTNDENEDAILGFILSSRDRSKDTYHKRLRYHARYTGATQKPHVYRPQEAAEGAKYVGGRVHFSEEYRRAMNYAPGSCADAYPVTNARRANAADASGDTAWSDTDGLQILGGLPLPPAFEHAAGGALSLPPHVCGLGGSFCGIHACDQHEPHTAAQMSTLLRMAMRLRAFTRGDGAVEGATDGEQMHGSPSPGPDGESIPETPPTETYSVAKRVFTDVVLNAHKELKFQAEQTAQFRVTAHRDIARVRGCAGAVHAIAERLLAHEYLLEVTVDNLLSRLQHYVAAISLLGSQERHSDEHPAPAAVDRIATLELLPAVLQLLLDLIQSAQSRTHRAKASLLLAKLASDFADEFGSGRYTWLLPMIAEQMLDFGINGVSRRRVDHGDSTAPDFRYTSTAPGERGTESYVQLAAIRALLQITPALQMLRGTSPERTPLLFNLLKEFFWAVRPSGLGGETVQMGEEGGPLLDPGFASTGADHVHEFAASAGSSARATGTAEAQTGPRGSATTMSWPQGFFQGSLHALAQERFGEAMLPPATLFRGSGLEGDSSDETGTLRNQNNKRPRELVVGRYGSTSARGGGGLQFPASTAREHRKSILIHYFEFCALLTKRVAGDMNLQAVHERLSLEIMLQKSRDIWQVAIERLYATLSSPASRGMHAEHRTDRPCASAEYSARLDLTALHREHHFASFAAAASVPQPPFGDADMLTTDVNHTSVAEPYQAPLTVSLDGLFDSLAVNLEIYTHVAMFANTEPLANIVALLFSEGALGAKFFANSMDGSNSRNSVLAGELPGLYFVYHLEDFRGRGSAWGIRFSRSFLRLRRVVLQFLVVVLTTSNRPRDGGTAGQPPALPSIHRPPADASRGAGPSATARAARAQAKWHGDAMDLLEEITAEHEHLLLQEVKRQHEIRAHGRGASASIGGGGPQMGLHAHTGTAHPVEVALVICPKLKDRTTSETLQGQLARGREIRGSHVEATSSDRSRVSRGFSRSKYAAIVSGEHGGGLDYQIDFLQVFFRELRAVEDASLTRQISIWMKQFPGFSSGNASHLRKAEEAVDRLINAAQSEPPVLFRRAMRDFLLERAMFFNSDVVDHMRS